MRLHDKPVDITDAKQRAEIGVFNETGERHAAKLASNCILVESGQARDTNHTPAGKV